MNELITVIITTHNRNVFLIDRAVNSVLNQTYQNTEIILVSDNFDNKDLQIEISNYFKNRYPEKLHLVLPHENLGANRARNLGASFSKGSLLAFLDDDDVWFYNKLEMQQAAISVSNDVALVYCDEYGFDEKSNFIFSKNYIDISKKPLDYFFKKGNIIGGASNPLVRKDCFDKIGGFDEALLSSQDLDLWVRIAQTFKLLFVNKKLLICFYHNDSFSGITNNFIKKDSGYNQFCEKHWSLISKKRPYLKRVYQYKCLIAIMSKDKRLFKERFHFLLNHFPFSFYSNAKIYLSWLKNK